jgi:hypothetical protein
MNVARGSHTIGAPVRLANDTVISVLSADSNLSITGGVNAEGVNVAKTGAGVLRVNQIKAAALSINAGAIQITPGSGAPAPGPSVVSSLSISGGEAPVAVLDLKDGSAVINYAGASPAPTIRQQIIAGRGGTGLAASWNGKGITSSAAAEGNATQPESRSVGYAENSALPLGPYTNFRGQAVDNTAILMAFTRTGDANLDGVVNDDDVTVVGASYAPGVANPHWALGDFDYNGFVDDDDVTLLGAFYDPSAPPLAAPPTALSANAVATVPEPSSLVLVALGISLVFAVAVCSAKRRIAVIETSKCKAFRRHDTGWKASALVGFVIIIAPIVAEAQVIPSDAVFERVATGFRFTEGPAYDRQGGVWFTAIDDNRILRFDIAAATTEVMVENSGRANGLMFDNDGRLLAAEMGGRRVVRRQDGDVTVLADMFDGRRLNAPNDLVIDSNNGVFLRIPRLVAELSCRKQCTI